MPAENPDNSDSESDSLPWYTVIAVKFIVPPLAALIRAARWFSSSSSDSKQNTNSENT